MIRNNAQLKYAMKRKVSLQFLYKYSSESRAPSETCDSLFLSNQRFEDDETFKLLQLSKEDQKEPLGDQEDEELVVAEYESDDESKTRSR